MLLPSSPSRISSVHGQIAQLLEVRPRDVPERDDRRLRQLLADQLRRQREVVVLHEDDRVVGVHFLDDGTREACSFTAW